MVLKHNKAVVMKGLTLSLLHLPFAFAFAFCILHLNFLPNFRIFPIHIFEFPTKNRLLDLKLWQQGVLMSTPLCQISMANRLVVSENEVPKVLVSQECRLFFETPCRNSSKLSIDQRR